MAGAAPAGPLTGLDAASAASQPSSVAAEIVAVPVNQAALQNGYRITVSQPGLQEVLFSAFGAGFDSTRLHLTHGGETVAVEVLADRLRFFVPEVGDRWNQNAVYWLTFDGGGAQINATVATSTDASRRSRPVRRLSAASGATTNSTSPNIPALTPITGTTHR